MADQNRKKEKNFKRLKHGYYHDIIGEAFLAKDKHGNVIEKRIPRNYLIKFFIFLRPGEKVTEIEFKVVQQGLGNEENGVVTQLVNLTTNNAKPPKKLGEGKWKGYEFEITKDESDALVLSFSVNEAVTDPKPKVIFQDPLEIDPADDAKH